MKIALSSILSRVLIAEMIPATNLDLWIRNIPSRTITFTYAGKSYEFEWVLPKRFLSLKDKEFLNHLKSIAGTQVTETAQGVWERGLHSLRNATIPFELRFMNNTQTEWIDPDDFVDALTRYDNIAGVAVSLDRLSQGIIMSATPPDMESFRQIVSYLRTCQKYPRTEITSYSDLNLISLQEIGIPPRLFRILSDVSDKNTSNVGVASLIDFMKENPIEKYCTVKQAESINSLASRIREWYSTRQGTLRDLAVAVIKPELESSMGWEDTSVSKVLNITDIQLSPDLARSMSEFWGSNSPSRGQIEFYIKWRDILPKEIDSKILKQLLEDFSQTN